MTIDWKKGLPTDPGIYWFTAVGRKETPLVLEVREGKCKHEPWYHIVGHHGSGPLSCFYVESLDEKGMVWHSKIEEPDPDGNWKWDTGPGYSYAWVQNGRKFGFALIDRNYCTRDEASIHIIWTKTDDNTGGLSSIIHRRDGYLFQKINVPPTFVDK